MQLTARAEDMCAALQVAASVVEKKDPIRSLVKIDAKKGALDFYTVGNKGGHCITVINCKVKTAGIVFVDATTLLSVLKKCEEDTELSVKDNNLEVRNQNYKAKIIIVAESKKGAFPFKVIKGFDSIEGDLQELAAVMKYAVSSAGNLVITEERGIGVLPEGKGVRISAIDRNGALGYTALVKCKVKDDLAGVIASTGLGQFLMSLSRDGDDDVPVDISLGIDGGTVAVSHPMGYSYFPLLNGKPMETKKYLGLLKLDSPVVCVSAGLFNKAIKSVLLMGDAEEGYKGRMLGCKGKIEVFSYSNSSGAAKNSVITAGDLVCDQWYNFRLLSDYISRIDPEQEIRLHAVKGTVLVVQFDNSAYWLSPTEAPEGMKNAASKS